MASIGKTDPREGGNVRWWAQVFFGRDPETRVFHYRRKTFDTQREAKRWAREQEKAKENGDRPRTDKRSVAQYLTWWLDAKAAGRVYGKKRTRRARIRTMAGYRECLARWIIAPPTKYTELPRIGAGKLAEITYHTLDRLYDAMLTYRYTTERGVRSLHGVLRQAFEELVRTSVLGRNPADWAHPPADEREAPDHRADAMNSAQAAAFLSAAREVEAETCYSAYWHLLLQTGLRPGEAFALKWADVRLEEPDPCVEVKHDLVRVAKGQWVLEKPKTKNSLRTVPLPAAALRELKAWRARQRWWQQRAAGDQWQNLGFVFTKATGQPLWSGARHSFGRVMRKASLGTWGPAPDAKAWRKQHAHGPLPPPPFAPGFRIYDLRHTFVTLLLQQGVPPHVVSKLAGHHSVAFTLTYYGHALPEQRADAARKMDAMFGTA